MTIQILVNDILRVQSVLKMWRVKELWMLKLFWMVFWRANCFWALKSQNMNGHNLLAVQSFKISFNTNYVILNGFLKGLMVLKVKGYDDSNYFEQESPPAGNHKRRTVHGITCQSAIHSGGGGEPSFSQNWGGLPHPLPIGKDEGTPSCQDLDGGTTSPLPGVPPSEQTDKCRIITFPVLRMRAVMIFEGVKWYFFKIPRCVHEQLIVTNRFLPCSWHN